MQSRRGVRSTTLKSRRREPPEVETRSPIWAPLTSRLARFLQMEREILRSSTFIPLSFAVFAALIVLLLLGVSSAWVSLSLRVLAAAAAIYQTYLWRRPPPLPDKALPPFTPRSITFTLVLTITLILSVMYGFGKFLESRD